MVIFIPGETNILKVSQIFIKKCESYVNRKLYLWELKICQKVIMEYMIELGMYGNGSMILT